MSNHPGVSGTFKRATGSVQLSRSRHPWAWFFASWGWTYFLLMLSLRLAGSALPILSEGSLLVAGLSVAAVLLNKSPFEIGPALFDRRRR